MTEQEKESKYPFGFITGICGFLRSYVREDKQDARLEQKQAGKPQVGFTRLLNNWVELN